MITDDYKDYHAGNKDAWEYHIKLFLFAIIIYGCFIAYASEWLSVGWMAVIVSVCVTRWLIAFHELFHLRDADELDFITRLQPIPFSPLNLGYREFRDIHKGHHIHTATDKDPDAFHIQGGMFKAFIGSMFLQEQATIRYIASHGISRELLLMMVLRLSLFMSLFQIAPAAFIAWWLVLRLTYIVNDFVFFHVVHYRAGETGTFSLPLPVWLMVPFIVVYGYDVVYATMYHDIHHKHSLVAAKQLPMVAALCSEAK